MAQGNGQGEHFAQAKVKQRIDVSFSGLVQQALKIEVGDILWFWRSEDGAVVVKKAPDKVQELSKAKQTKDR